MFISMPPAAAISGTLTSATYITVTGASATVEYSPKATGADGLYINFHLAI